MKPATITGIGVAIYFLSFNIILILRIPKLQGYLSVTAFAAILLSFSIVQTGVNLPRAAFLRWGLLIGAFLTIIGGSYLVNISDYDDSIAQKVLGYSSIFLIASTAAITQGTDGLKSSLLASWIGQLILVAIILGFNNRSGGGGRLVGPFDSGYRMETVLKPCDVGEIALITFALSPVCGWRGVSFTFPIAFYTMYLANARGAMISVLFSLGMFVFAREIIGGTALWRHGYVTLRGLIIVSVLCFAAVILPVLMWSFVSEDVLQLSHAKRGVGSGLTGRTEIWGELFRQWQEKPLLGHGYGIVKNDAIAAETPTDGGYLMVLAELGVLGLMYFVVVSIITVSVSLSSVARAGSSLGITLFVYSGAFCFINLVESRIVGTGNNGLGIFFMIFSVCSVTPQALSGVASGAFVLQIPGEVRPLKP